MHVFKTLSLLLHKTWPTLIETIGVRCRVVNHN